MRILTKLLWVNADSQRAKIQVEILHWLQNSLHSVDRFTWCVVVQRKGSGESAWIEWSWLHQFYSDRIFQPSTGQRKCLEDNLNWNMFKSVYIANALMTAALICL